MSVPENTVQAQGQGSASAGFLNTAVQSCFNVSMLRGFLGVDGMQVLLEGTTSFGDGGQGTFGYVSTSAATDDNGVTCVKPNAAGPTGRWLRLPQPTGAIVPPLPATLFYRTIVYVLDGGGSVLSTGVGGQTGVTFSGTIQSVTLLADQTGSVVVDIWKTPYASYPPTDANTIVASDTPTITAAQKYQDTVLTGWTTAIAVGDTFMFNVDSVTTITRVTILLGVLTT